MKVKLQVAKGRAALCAGTYDITDADSFGAACADLWCKLQQQQLAKESSVGALMEHINDDVLGLLNGAAISLDRV